MKHEESDTAEKSITVTDIAASKRRDLLYTIKPKDGAINEGVNEAAT